MQVITMIKKNKRKYAKITHYNTLLKNKNGDLLITLF